jgi:hypothetical protein
MLSSMLPIPVIEIPNLSSLPPFRPLVLWTAARLFHLSSPQYAETGSGDRPFDWALQCCILAAALAAAAIWSTLDRKRPAHPTLYRWFHLGMRLALGSTFLSYGMVKLAPLQMPYPFLSRLVEPFGNFSPMGVLWTSVGAAPAYEMFTGFLELLAGVLLLVPRTALLGTWIALADAIEIFVLNMTYDVPVKLLSFHLIVMALVLLGPELPRFFRVFFSDRDSGPPATPPLFRTPRAKRIAAAAQMVLAVLLLASNAWNARTSWRTYGAGAPKPPLYGIWNVDEMRWDGQVMPPLLTDRQRWRRLIFEFPGRVQFQRPDDSTLGYRGEIDATRGTMALSGGKASKASLQFRRTDTHLTVSGDMDGHRLELQLTLVDRAKFLLVSRGFHWVQENPFNR